MPTTYKLVLILITLCTLTSTSEGSTQDAIKKAALELIKKNGADKEFTSMNYSNFKKKANVDGKSVKDIYELNFQEDKNRYIIKTFNNELTFKKECEKYESLKKFLSHYTVEANSNSSLPAFAQYIGAASINGINIAVFQRAPGESLLDFLARFAITKELDLDSKKKAFNTLKKVGKVIALFHIRYKTQDLSQFHTKIHGDLHISNIFYYDGRVTFIDYETLRNGNVNTDIAKLFHYQETSIAQKAVDILRTQNPSSNSTPNPDLPALYKKIQDMYQTIVSGYNDELEKSDLPYYLHCTFKPTCSIKKKS